jgi:2,5-diamino-6-(ribosylamino)-4(3H)-pyrimidinone 5'-phosphate reductase
MRPETIVHNTLGVDGAVRGFPVDMGVHYGLVAEFGVQAHLIGSETVRAGIEDFGEDIGPEIEADLHPPETAENDQLPWWVIVDSGGRLGGLLHGMRRFEFCRDAVVLVSDTTPSSYLEYLQTRSYRHHVVGRERVDLAEAMALLSREYRVNKLLIDSGPALVGALLDAGLVDRISLVLAPHLAGCDQPTLFSKARGTVALKLQHHAPVGDGSVHLLYEVAGPARM